MRLLTRFCRVALPVAVWMLTASIGVAQPASADEDQAKAMLARGLKQFGDLDFRAAQATLLKVDRTGLSMAEKKTLDGHLTRIPGAILNQAAARQALSDARKALKAGELDAARKGFAKAAASADLPAVERNDASKQVALVEQRLRAAAAASRETPAPPPPAPVAPAAVEPAPVAPAVVVPKPAPAAPAVVEPAPVPVAPAVVEPAPVPAAPAVVEPAPVPTAPAVVEPAPVPTAPAVVEPTPVPVPVAPVESKPTPVVLAAAPTAPAPVAAVTMGAPAAGGSDMIKKVLERRARMRKLIALGNGLRKAGNAGKAMLYYREAMGVDPSVPEADEARRLWSEAKDLSAASGGTPMMRRVQDRWKLEQISTLVEFEKAMKRAEEILARAKAPTDFDAAAADARLARNTIDAKKYRFADTEYRGKIIRVENLLTWIEKQREKWERNEVQKNRTRIMREEAARRDLEMKRKYKRIQMLTANAKVLRRQRKFREAINVLDQILQLDPENAWADEWKRWLASDASLRDEKELIRIRQDETKKTLLDVREAEIPWYELLKYPKDWRELTARRAGTSATAAAETEADRAVRAKLAAKISKLEFTDIEFKDVVQFLRDVTQLNIQVKWAALGLAGIDRSTAVNIHLQDVSADKALRVILDDIGGGSTRLSYVVEDGVVTISTKEDLSSRTVTRVYDIRDMIIRVPNFRGPRIEMSQISQGSGQSNTGSGSGGGTGFFDDGGGGGGGGGGGSGGARDSESVEGGELKTRKQLIDEILDLVRNTIDPTSWRTAGGEVGAIRELHGQLVVTQTSENHGSLLSLINQLREARTLQISIEARFITVNSGFLNRIGIDIDFYFNLGSHLNAHPTSNDPRVVDPFTGQSVSAELPFYNWRGRKSDRRFSPMGVMQNGSVFSNAIQTAVDGGIGQAVNLSGSNALGIAGHFLDDVQVDFLIEATQANSSSRILTAPRITLFNGQRAYITVAIQRAYVANYIPVVADNATAMRPVIGFVPTGTVLDVEATVSADRRYVTLTVRPQVAQLLNITTIPIAFTGGFAIIELPEVRVQDLQTTVSVPDGGTLLLGGQKDSGEVEREIGAPLLNKIPIINRFFSNRSKVRDERTLLILIKPKIIIQQEEEERAFPT